MGSSCFSRGNNRSLEIIRNYIADNDLDARIELVGSLCSEQCNRGPLITINGKIYYNVNPSTIIDIMNHVLKEAER